MFSTITKYFAKIPEERLISKGRKNKLGRTGSWFNFLWDFQLGVKTFKKQPLEKLKPGDRTKAFIFSGVALSSDTKRVIKIEFTPSARKKNTLKKEVKILLYLKNNGCVSCPDLIQYGKLPIEVIAKSLPKNWFVCLRENKIKHFQFYITKYIKSSKKVPLADVFFTILEQKGLGIYQGDLKPDNLRFDISTGVCYLIDYDQAIHLSDRVKKIKAKDFLNWCEFHDQKMYPQRNGTWRRFFPFLNTFLHINPLFKNGSFNLSKTSPHSFQLTTNTENGSYQKFNHPIVFVNGVRSIESRLKKLNKVKFKKNEKILDVGCNLGLITQYLAKRECKAFGIDLDPHIITTAQMLSNTLGIKKIKFSPADLDNQKKLEKFDTICLFSVFHHTKNLRNNAKKISNACNRILIECRLNEYGKRPKMTQSGRIIWETATIWSYPNIKALCSGLEKIFKSFYVTKNLGLTDKNRFLLEMKKNET